MVACHTSELLDTQGKQRADAAFGLNDPPRAWIGLQLAAPPQDPHVGAAVVRADARLITPTRRDSPPPLAGLTDSDKVGSYVELPDEVGP